MAPADARLENLDRRRRSACSSAMVDLKQMAVSQMVTRRNVVSSHKALRESGWWQRLMMVTAAENRRKCLLVR